MNRFICLAIVLASFTGCASTSEPNYHGSPMVMVPRLERWSSVSEDFANSRPDAFRTDLGLDLEFNRLSTHVTVVVRGLDDRNELITLTARQPDELTPFYTVDIPGSVIAGRTSFAIDVYSGSRISGYPGSSTLLISTQGATEVGAASQEPESIVLSRAIEARRQDANSGR